jgi:hypothetical protein
MKGGFVTAVVYQGLITVGKEVMHRFHFFVKDYKSPKRADKMLQLWAHYK